MVRAGTEGKAMGQTHGGYRRFSVEPSVRVSLLGHFAVAVDGQDYEPSHSCRRLVAFLALRGPVPIARERAAGMLWPDSNREHAAARLRTCLYRLGPVADRLLVRSDQTLCLAGDVVVDLRVAIDRGRKLADAGFSPSEAELDSRLFAYELLPGWDEDWLTIEREAFQELRFAALEAIAARLTTLGRFEDAIQACFVVIRVEPLRESAHRLMARAHAGDGNHALALRRLDQFAALMAKELGAQPSELVIDLRDELLQASGPVGGSSAPASSAEPGATGDSPG